MTRREHSRDEYATGAQRVSGDELQRARQRSGMHGVRPWTTRRRGIGLAQTITAKDKAEWLVQEEHKAQQVELTSEEIKEDKGSKR